MKNQILITLILLLLGCEDTTGNSKNECTIDCENPKISYSSSVNYNNSSSSNADSNYISVAAVTVNGQTTVAWAYGLTEFDSEQLARERCANESGSSQAWCKSATSYQGCVEVYVEKQVADQDPSVSFSDRIVSAYSSIEEAEEQTDCLSYPKASNVSGITMYCVDRQVKCWESNFDSKSSSSESTPIMQSSTSETNYEIQSISSVFDWQVTDKGVVGIFHDCIEVQLNKVTSSYTDSKKDFHFSFKNICDYNFDMSASIRRTVPDKTHFLLNLDPGETKYWNEIMDSYPGDVYLLISK